MEIKRPRSRDKGEAKEGKGVFKRGEGTGQGPVGSGQGPKVGEGLAQKLQEMAKEEFKKHSDDADDGPESISRGPGFGTPGDKSIDLGDILGALGNAALNSNQQAQQQQAQQQAHQLYQQQMQQQAQQQYQQQPQPPFESSPQYSNDQGNYGSQGGYGGNTPKRKSSRLGCLLLIIALVIIFVLFMKMSNSGSSNNGGNSNSNSNSTPTTNTESSNTGTGSSYGFGGLSSTGGSNASLFGGTSTTGASVAAGSGYSTGWQLSSNNGTFNTQVSEDARAKYTTLKGNGQDEMTLLVYMCGTDLESNYAMATRDLQEMLAATLSDKVKIVLFTGGCTRWQNDVMSNNYNQIYDITPAGLRRVNDNAGNSSMTDPDTLEAFVKWGAENYPSNRMALIFWDHGGGSVSGYGYDQRYQRTGAMSLTEINSALSNAGVKFDFIGFDACLMATAETALMASNYADYLIASEETEPGIGWYYSDWLTNLSANTSIPTVELGKQIIDDFTTRCQRECPGQNTTLSIVDLAELQKTLPARLSAFGQETTKLIEEGNYMTVAKARSSSQEFSRESQIDQIDFVHFANLLGTESGKALNQAIINAVKYNRTSKGMPNAYGLSIFFPYRRLSSVDTMTQAYSTLGLDSSLAKCIKQFAQMQVSGQASSGGSSSPFWSLLNSDGNGYWSSGSNYGSGYGSNSGSGSYGGTISSSDLEALLGQLLGGSVSSYDSYGLYGLDGRNTRFMTEDTLDKGLVQKYVSDNMMNAEDFVLKENADGFASIQLTDDQWARITSVEMSMFYDDGEGYLDLGLDNIYDIDKDGNLLPVVDNSWISIDGQPVAYYHLFTYESEDGSEYSIVGRVPIMLNDQRADLILTFDQDKPEGYIAGVRYTYPDGEADAVAKAQEALSEGDVIDFLCDYYAYDGTFKDSYFLGEQYTVGADPSAIEISNTIVGDDIIVTYKFQDIFGETYWTPALK